MSPSSFTLDEVPAVTACTLDTLKCLTLSSMDSHRASLERAFSDVVCRWLQDVLDAPLIIMLTDGKFFHLDSFMRALQEETKI